MLTVNGRGERSGPLKEEVNSFHYRFIVIFMCQDKHDHPTAKGLIAFVHDDRDHLNIHSPGCKSSINSPPSLIGWGYNISHSAKKSPDIIKCLYLMGNCSFMVKQIFIVHPYLSSTHCLYLPISGVFLLRNELERLFLEMLQFNINVPSSVYAKYYFDLRALADAHDLSFPLEALSKERALKLEVTSCFCFSLPFFSVAHVSKDILNIQQWFFCLFLMMMCTAETFYKKSHEILWCVYFPWMTPVHIVKWLVLGRLSSHRNHSKADNGN